MASQVSSTSSKAVLRDRPFVQVRVAEAEAILSAARSYVVDAVGTAWDAVVNDMLDPCHAIAKARLAIVHAMHEAVRSVDMVFHAAGTNAIYSHHPLERHFRDIHVAVQHSAALHTHYESAGKVLMGSHLAEPGGEWQITAPLEIRRDNARTKTRTALRNRCMERQPEPRILV